MFFHTFWHLLTEAFIVNVGGKCNLCFCPLCITFCVAKLRWVRGAIWFTQDDRYPTYILTANHLGSCMSCGLYSGLGRTTLHLIVVLQLSISVMSLSFRSLARHLKFQQYAIFCELHAPIEIDFKTNLNFFVYVWQSKTQMVSLLHKTAGLI